MYKLIKIINFINVIIHYNNLKVYEVKKTYLVIVFITNNNAKKSSENKNVRFFFKFFMSRLS